MNMGPNNKKEKKCYLLNAQIIEQFIYTRNKLQSQMLIFKQRLNHKENNRVVIQVFKNKKSLLTIKNISIKTRKFIKM